MQVMRQHVVNAAVTLFVAAILGPLFYVLRDSAGDPVSWQFALGYGLVIISPWGLWRSWQDAEHAS